MRKRRRKRAEWERLVALFNDSGLSRGAFARLHGVNAETLRK